MRAIVNTSCSPCGTAWPFQRDPKSLRKSTSVGGTANFDWGVIQPCCHGFTSQWFRYNRLDNIYYWLLGYEQYRSCLHLRVFSLVSNCSPIFMCVCWKLDEVHQFMAFVMVVLVSLVSIGHPRDPGLTCNFYEGNHSGWWEPTRHVNRSLLFFSRKIIMEKRYSNPKDHFAWSSIPFFNTSPKIS